MSLIIVSLLDNGQRALVATDTAATHTQTGAPIHTSKMIPFLHVNAILAGRGNRRFLLDVFSTLFDALGIWSFDDALEGFGRQIDAMYGEWARRFRSAGAEPDSGGQELVLVGWSEREARFIGLAAIRQGSMTTFEARQVRSGHVTPWDQSIGNAATPDSVAAIEDLARAQVRHYSRTSPAVPLGGRLLVAELRVGRMEIHDRPI